MAGWVEALPGYAVGTLGAFWTIQRTASLFGCDAHERRGRRGRLAAAWSGLAPVAALAAFAHPRGGQAIGFIAGLAHPVSGLDHVLAMIAVGVWGAQLGPPALWILPVMFPMVMAFGGMLGLRRRASARRRDRNRAVGDRCSARWCCSKRSPPLAIAAALVGFFAIFHGHAHGTELPAGASGLLYSIGFVVATGCCIGRHRDRHGPSLAGGTRGAPWAGAAVALAGLAFLWRALT